MTNSFSFVVTSGVNTYNQKKKYVQHYRTSTALPSSNLDDNNDNHYDLIVLGAGPVGVCAACKAATSPFHKRVCLVDAPRASGVLMNGEQDLSIGGPTGLFSKALRDTSKRIKVSSLRGMGLRDDRYQHTNEKIVLLENESCLVAVVHYYLLTPSLTRFPSIFEFPLVTI